MGNSSKERDKDCMDTFDCKGWLHITLSDLSDTAYVKIEHCDDHIPYWPIDVPAEIEELVREHANLNPRQARQFI